jgi:hypothetical protein
MLNGSVEFDLNDARRRGFAALQWRVPCVDTRN